MAKEDEMIPGGRGGLIRKRGAPKGNHNAKKAAVWSKAVRDEAYKRGTLAKLAKALIAKGLEGDMQALREIGDRLEGKVPQAIVGDGENPIGIAIEVSFK